MRSRHSRAHASRAGRQRRSRLVIVLLAPLLVLIPLSARATSTTSTTGHKGTATAASTAKAVTKAKPAVAAKRMVWSRSWSPGLALLSDFQKCCATKAGFHTLPYSYDFTGSQKVTATATFKTRWVDIKALIDGPNIAQQGRFASAAQFKLQIFHGPNRSDHRGQCRIKGTTGSILAFGPAIDVTDGRWHTITCVKSPDTTSGTKVVVIVDGVAGKAKISKRPIGTVLPPGRINLGGRSSTASTDSLDGWIRSISFAIG